MLIAEWNAGVEMKITEADRVACLKAWLKEAKREDSQKVWEDKLEFEHKLFLRLDFISKLNCEQPRLIKPKRVRKKQLYTNKILELPIISGIHVKKIQASPIALLAWGSP